MKLNDLALTLPGVLLICIQLLCGCGMRSATESTANVSRVDTQHPKESDLASAGTNMQLLQAAAAGNLKKVQDLVNSGANINYQADGGSGFTALHWAVFERNYDVAIYLLKKGADPNIAEATGLRPIDLVSAGDTSAESDALLQLLNEKLAK